MGEHQKHYVQFGLLTSDHDDEVLFIKAYSLKRNIIRGDIHVKPDDEKAASDTTLSVGGDAKDERSDRFDQSFQVGRAGENEHIAIDVVGSTFVRK